MNVELSQYHAGLVKSLQITAKVRGVSLSEKEALRYILNRGLGRENADLESLEKPLIDPFFALEEHGSRQAVHIEDEAAVEALSDEGLIHKFTKEFSRSIERRIHENLAAIRRKLLQTRLVNLNELLPSHN